MNRRDKEKIKELEKLNFSNAEVARIKEQRKFDDIKPNTFTYDLALHLDALRRNYRTQTRQISEILLSIESILNNVVRCREELESEHITTELKDGVKMSKSEMMTHIRHQLWVCLGQAQSIAPILAEIRALVGHKDLAGNLILTEEQYMQYVIEIRNRMKELGYDLFC